MLLNIESLSEKMEKRINELKEYLIQLEKDTGWQIIIEDYYGVLHSYAAIEDFLSDKKWHTNPYCMEIKKNPRLWKRCVNLKRATRRGVRKRGRADFTVCYCGVAEYTVPVFASGVHIASLCATGFYSPLSDKMLSILAKRTEKTTAQLEQIRKENLREKNEDAENQLKIYLKMAADIIKEICNDSPLIHTRENHIDHQQQYVLTAIDHIEKHYRENITPESVAERFHISLSYLQHLFVSLKGEGIATVIRKKRLQSACELLVGTNRSVRDIALSCGFFDTDYFSVVFKRVYGITPLKYRSQNIKT